MRSALLAALLLLASSVSSARAAETVLSSIEAEGVSHLSPDELQSVLELGAGDSFDSTKARRSVDNLIELYRYRGYPEARVVSAHDPVRQVWALKVVEGRPLRIAAVAISPESDQQSSFRSHWSRLEAALLRRLDLSSGDVFDQDRASTTARALQALLVDEEYIGASVNEVQVEKLQQPPPDLATGAEAAAGWVRLRIRVDLGERVSFGFRGNRHFSRNELITMVREQRALGLGKNYIETLRNRMLDDYRATGFTDPTITAFPQERPSKLERHITWVIVEGPRTRLDGIVFDGSNSFSQDELLGIFRDGLGGALSRGIYVEKDFQKAVEFFIQKLRSRGYLGARSISTQYQWSEDHSKVSATLYFYEGEQTRVGAVRLSGLGELDSEMATNMLGVRMGEPLNLFAFGEGVQRLKAWYRDRGHLDAAVADEGSNKLVRYRDENRVADIEIEVDPGPRYRVGAIVVEGLQKTQESVVLRELSLRAGDVLAEREVLESEARLRRMGLFSTAQIRLEADSTASDRRIVHVAVQEGTPGLIAGGLGFRNDLGLRVFGQTSYSNLFGRNHAIVFNVNANRRFIERRVPLESQIQLGYVWPWFVIPELTFRPSVTLQRTQYESFDATSLVLSGTLERRLLARPNLMASLAYNLERTEQVATDPGSIDNQTLTIGALIGSLKLDLRNNPLAPTRGFFSAFSYELADPALLSQTDPFPVGYTRLQFRADYLLPVWRDASWYFSFRTGLERNTQDISDPRVAIPLIKQFTLGGAGSLRGFKEQELNIQDFAVRGTASYVNYRMQLDLPVSGPMRIGPFLDAANLLIDRYSLGADLRLGTGFGLHYLTPVGPVNFDLGFKTAPRPGEDRYRFYFSIGVI